MISVHFLFVDCGNIVEIGNGNISYKTNSTLFESEATISCQPGYRIQSSGRNEDKQRSVKCNETGHWNSTHQCELQGK